MTRQLLWVLLAVSLALNLGLAGGAVYFKSEAESLAGGSAGEPNEVARRLQLSDRQRAGLMDLRERLQTRRAAFLPSRDVRRADFLTELAKPELDRSRIAEIMDSGSDERVAFVQDLMVELHALLATFSSDQKQEFLAMARERHFLRRLFGFGPGRNDPKAEARAQAQN